MIEMKNTEEKTKTFTFKDYEVAGSYKLIKENLNKIPKGVLFKMTRKLRLLEPIHKAYIDDVAIRSEQIRNEAGNTIVKDGNETFTPQGARAMNEMERELSLRTCQIEVLGERLTEEQLALLPDEINEAIYTLEQII